MANVGPILADIFNLSEGLNIIFESETGAAPQLFPIAAGDITDNIQFALIFNDDTDLFTGAFSLDGGTTYQNPFNPIYSHLDHAVFADWELNATSIDVQAVPEPTTFLLMATGLVGFDLARRKKLMW